MAVTEAVPYRITIDLVSQILQFGRHLGLPVDTIMSQHGVALTPLPEQPAFMSGAVFEQILAVGMRLLDDPLPGLYAARLQLTTVFGLLSFLAQTSSTVGSLLDTLIQVEPLLGDTGLTRLERQPGIARLHWDCRFTDPYVRAHASDFILAAYAFGVAAAARPGQRVLEEVHLQHEAPDDSAQLQRYSDTFRCPVYFRRPGCMLVLQEKTLELSLPTANPQLHGMLEQHARQIMEERNHVPSVPDLARLRLRQLLAQGEASRERLAEAMGICGRTLHRRLKDSGTSYRELLDELRLELAHSLLRDARLSIQDVAERAGFDESPSFTRWFRQLTGTTPTEFRQGLATGA